MRRFYVAVCGPHDADATETALAAECGRLLAQAGAVVVCGGRGGAMAAAARGASEAGGLVVGILDADGHGSANPHCTVTIPTGMGEARNALIARTADALIAVGGGWGTLSEVALAMKMRRTVVSLDGWEPHRHGRPEPGIRHVRTAEEAVRIAVTAAKAARS